MALGCLRSEKNAAPPLEPAATPTAPIGTLEVRLRRDRLDLEYIARRFFALQSCSGPPSPSRLR